MYTLILLNIINRNDSNLIDESINITHISYL